MVYPEKIDHSKKRGCSISCSNKETHRQIW